MQAGGSRGAVVVTGSSTGIGRASALRLDRLGFRVFAGVRKPEDGEALRAAASERLEPVILDVTRADQIATAAERVGEASPGGIAGLVNNAGMAVGGPLEAIPIEDFRDQIEVNLIGQIAVTQAFLPALRPARGRIVFVSSIGGLVAGPYMAPYHASKFGIEAVGDALRQELREFGIQVSIIEPGSVATPIWEKGRDTADAVRERLTAEHRSLYGSKMERVGATVTEMGARGTDPDNVAVVIERALTVRRPRTRYLVGTDARVMATLRRLVPDRLRDRLMARATGL